MVDYYKAKSWKAIAKQKVKKRCSSSKTRLPRPPSQLEEDMAVWLRSCGIQATREYRFHPNRYWRFDFALVELRIAIECEGGVYQQGRHTRGTGFESDALKYNEAAIMGWTVLRFTRRMIDDGTAFAQIERVVQAKQQ